jgi:hypothetical protein
MCRSEDAVAEVLWEDEKSDAVVEARRDRLIKYKHAYLHDLSCVRPEQHRTGGHTCSLGDDKSAFILVLSRYHQQEVPLLRAMQEKLPEELVAKIMAMIVVNNGPDVFHLRDFDDIQLLSASILSDEIVEAALYRSVLERAIFETLLVRLDITFESGGTDGSVLAEVPNLVLTVLPRVRKLAMRLDLEQPFLGLDRVLSDTNSGIVSLRCQLSAFRLCEFTVEIVYKGMGSPPGGMYGLTLARSILRSSCLVAPGKHVTFREACESLIEAVKVAEIGRA